ncbi:MAG: FlgD immunoglobulin-like domain containing protein [Calditrichia bacterium]
MFKKALSVMIVLSLSLFAKEFNTKKAQKVTPADEERWEQKISGLGNYPQTQSVQVAGRVEIGRTWYDYATNNVMGRMISYAPNGIHVTFMKRAGSATATRYVTYDYFDYSFGDFFGNQSVTTDRQTGWGRLMTGKDGEAIISLHNNPTQMWFDTYDINSGPGYNFQSNVGVETNPGVFAGQARHGDTLVFITQGASEWADGSFKYSFDYGTTWNTNSALSVAADNGNGERWPDFNPTNPSQIKHGLSITPPEFGGDPVIGGATYFVTTNDWGVTWDTTRVTDNDEVFLTKFGQTTYSIAAFQQFNAMFTQNGTYHMIFSAVQAIRDTMTSTLQDYKPILYWNDSLNKLVQINDTLYAAPSDTATITALQSLYPGNGIGNAYAHIAEGPNGELLAVWQQWEASPVDGSIVTAVGSGGIEKFMTDIWGAYSPDGGTTWSYTFKIAGNPGESDVYPNIPENFKFDASGDSIIVDLAYMFDPDPGCSLFADENGPAEAIWYYERVGINTNDLTYKPSFGASATDYDVLFTNDMSVQIAVGNFDPNNAADIAFVRGSFNGWSEDNPMSPNIFTPTDYEALVVINLTPQVDTVAYKFFYRSAANGDVWEGGADYKFTPTGNETDTDANGNPNYDVPRRFFDNVTVSDVFTTAEDIIFEADMYAAAAFLADSGAITFGGGNVTAIDTVYLAGSVPKTTPALAWVWDLTPGDPAREALQMNDTGTNGDAVAADGVWSITINFGVGAPKNIFWKHGISGHDNEAGFQQDWNENVAEVAAANGGRVYKIFGANGDYYTAYVGIEDLDEDFFSQPETYALFQNYPNPFNPSTTIEFALSSASNVTLEIFNIVGQKVRTLVSDRMIAGGYQAVWDGRDDRGTTVGTGVYIYRLTANDFVQTRKMLLVK